MESYLKKLVTNRKKVVITDVNDCTWNGIIKYFDGIGIVLQSEEGGNVMFPFTGIASVQED